MKNVLLAVLSGFLITAGFPKPEMFYVSWFALIPLLLAVHGKNGRQALFLGYVCGLVHFMTTLFWIRHAVYHYGGFPFFTALAILFLLCLMMAIYPAAFAFMARRWEGSPLLYVFGLPFVWVTLEWIRAHAITGFPWANLGYTQTPLNLLIQAADITGVYGLSWLVVLASTVITGFLKGYCRKTGIAVLAGCICVSLIYGTWRRNEIRSAQELAPRFTVSAIQGNIEQNEKWDPAFVHQTLKRYESLSVEAVRKNPGTDLLFWPESAMPFFYGLDEALTPEVNKIVKEADKPLLFGSIGVTLVDGKARMLNRAYLLDADARLLGAYAKQHLVPFGEYVPLSNILFFVKHLVAGNVEFASGRESGPIYFKGLPMGVLVCYEVVFPDISRETVRRGAEILMNLTNDAWYGDTGGPYQHLQMSRWRAIEFRVPLVRAANTGVSAAFDATGAECGRLGLNEAGSLACTVRPMHQLTFYARFGDVFAWFSVIAAVCGLLYGQFYSKLGRRKIQ